MKGAVALLRTLVAGGVEACFMNPGTSEMHFVAALDAVPEVTPVLTLFEGVATGAADGYGRMAGRPAATLLHLGPGLGNGIANLHNARRAGTPLVNIVGDHATYHKRFDAPLESDIESLAMPVSGWFRSSASPEEVSRDASEAIAAALGPPGCVATLVLPADVSWLETEMLTGPLARPEAHRRDAPEEALKDVQLALESGEPSVILLGGPSLSPEGILAASRIARRTGARLFAEPFPARMARGDGVPPIERLAYFGEFVVAQLGEVKHLVLVDAKEPVSPFAYPDKPSYLVPEGCTVHVLTSGQEDCVRALEELGERVGVAGAGAEAPSPPRPERPSGALTADTFAAAVGHLLPEGAIVSDESITSGIFLPGATAGSPRHDVLALTGNAIGQGLPLATGAAVACRERPVIALEADGSAMYTIQALWTQAREGLDVTTVLLDNGSYGILNMELGRVGTTASGPIAESMLDLKQPDIDFVALAESLGVPAARAETADELTDELALAISEEGPHLIHALLR